VSVDPAVFALTSRNGLVRVTCNSRFWIPCPRSFPAGFDRESWAAHASQTWWDTSGLRPEQNSVDRLAAMLRLIHEDSYATIPCHHIMVYVRDPAALPLPVHIGIWVMARNRDEQLLSLSGGNDPLVVRPPLVSSFTTASLGAGVKTIRHQRQKDDLIIFLLGYGFRSAEHATDVQVTVWAADSAVLLKAIPDIEDMIRGMTVYRNDTQDDDTQDNDTQPVLG